VHVRRKARQVALEILYEVDCAEHAVDDVIARRLGDEEDPLDDSTENFLRDIIHGVIQHQGALDAVIHRYAPEWPVDQMAIIDRNILRMAIFEIAIDEDTPLKVAINEAVELAKIYGSDSAPRFVNGVLGTLASTSQSALSATLVGRSSD
jgi:transcription antitermination protein NusB